MSVRTVLLMLVVLQLNGLVLSSSEAAGGDPVPQQRDALNVTAAPGAPPQSPRRLDVAVYYETLCGDSMLFMRRLHASWTVRKAFMNLELLPYGKATHHQNQTTGEWTIECQHGPAECRLNIVHACILDTVADAAVAFEVIACAMHDFQANLTECASLRHVDLAPVYECADSPRGVELFVAYGRRTKAIPMMFVPSIGADGAFNWHQQGDWLHRFDAKFCQKYVSKFGQRLDGCTG